MNVLVVDVGGTHIKVLVSGEREPRKFPSGPTLTAKQMVAWREDRLPGTGNTTQFRSASPGPCCEIAQLQNHAIWEAVGLALTSGRRSAVHVKLVNDAAMQGLGSYRRGKMLFLGLGTGLGSSLIVDGIVEPMELGHLPYKKGTYESYVGNEALVEQGKEKWRRHVADVVARWWRLLNRTRWF